MKQGDFTSLAQSYIHRSAYSETVLHILARSFGVQEEHCLADIGAGTGKLTEQLLAFGTRLDAVEPNEAMRKEGERLVQGERLRWHAGSAEHIPLEDQTIDWVLMASAFHWADPKLALREFHRILKPGGHLTLLWNPRDLSHPFHQAIESKIASIIPELKRVSSGSAAYTQDLEHTLLHEGLFDDLLFLEAPHLTLMSKERYLGAWRSVNDIQAQAGPDRFEHMMDVIEDMIAPHEHIEVPYRTRAWTVTRYSN